MRDYWIGLSSYFAFGSFISYIIWAFLVENTSGDEWYSRLLGVFIAMSVYVILRELKDIKDRLK